MSATLEAGTYRARARAWDLGLTAMGREQIWVEFEITAPESHAGTPISWYGYFSDKSWEITVESLRLMGWKGNDFTQLDGLDAKEVDLVIHLEEYPEKSGQWSPRVKWVNRAGAGGLVKPMSPTEKSYFAEDMKTKIAEFDKRGGRKRKGKQAGPIDDRPPPDDRDAPALDKDDIPF